MDKTKPVAKAGTKAPVVKPKKPEPEVKFDPVEAVVQKYREFGWTVMRSPKESLNDLIAQKIDAQNKPRLHFVIVVTTATIDHPDNTGIAKNTFIQNAFSNSAVPIFAHVVCNMKKAPDGSKEKSMVPTVTFEDVNLNARVIVGGNKKPVAKNNKVIDNKDNKDDKVTKD